MCLLFETIACKNGQLLNLKWHNTRLNASRNSVYKTNNQLFLEEIKIPEFATKGLWKCRVLYNETINGLSFEPYTPKLITSLKLVESNISYEFKYHNRDEIEMLYKQKEEADEIIIIKKGMVTDTSIANILLYDGLQWVTPNTPLLEGTMRAQLIETNKIALKSIKKTDLFSYKKIMFINAMNPFDESKGLEIEKVTIC